LPPGGWSTTSCAQLSLSTSPAEVPPPSTLALCPKCETPLLAGQEECPVCSKEIHEPPSTWTLLRLWRFARPYRGNCWPASC
jgi:hypothetical protein